MQILYWNLKAKNTPKLISMYLKDNVQNQTISKFYTNDKNILAIPMLSLNQSNFYENFLPRENLQNCHI